MRKNCSISHRRLYSFDNAPRPLLHSSPDAWRAAASAAARSRPAARSRAHRPGSRVGFRQMAEELGFAVGPVRRRRSADRGSAPRSGRCARAGNAMVRCSMLVTASLAAYSLPQPSASLRSCMLRAMTWNWCSLRRGVEREDVARAVAQHNRHRSLRQQRLTRCRAVAIQRCDLCPSDRDCRARRCGGPGGSRSRRATGQGSSRFPRLRPASGAATLLRVLP